MKKLTTQLLILSLLFCISSFAQIRVPEASPGATISQSIGLTKATITYSRPSVKGRKIFGDLVPFDKVWRMGANKITDIKFDDDVLVNGKLVKAGSYGLAAIPTVGDWTIILNSDPKQWGVYTYDDKKDVLRFTVKPTKTPALVEQMSIDFEDFTTTTTYIVAKWENMEVRFKVEQPNVDEKIIADIKEQTTKPEVSIDTYFTAADYYFQKGYQLDQALVWANKVLEKNKEYWAYQLVARVAAKQGNCAVALPNADKSMELAKKANDFAYIKLNEKVYADCGKK